MRLVEKIKIKESLFLLFEILQMLQLIKIEKEGILLNLESFLSFFLQLEYKKLCPWDGPKCSKFFWIF